MKGGRTHTIVIRIRPPPTLLRGIKRLRPVPNYPTDENDAPVGADVAVFGVEVRFYFPKPTCQSSS